MSLVKAVRRLSIFSGVIGMVGASLSGCGGGGSNIIPPPTGHTAACAANTVHNDGRARWTVLVYMNAANNLQPDSLTNIAQMASIGSDANVNIVVQWKQASCSDCGSPSFIGTNRYLLRKHNQSDINQILNGNTAVLAADQLAAPLTNSGGTSDMGDYRVLKDFASWGALTFPADNLALVIWDHGSGWEPTRAAKNRLKPSFRAVSQDSASNNEIETEQIPIALTNLAQPLDMLILDCSLEQMAEVAYEVRHSARVMVGSEESPPGAGYPYDAWLQDLKNSGKNPCDVGDSIISRFVQAYPAENNITQSMLDLSFMDNLAAYVKNFSSSLRSHINDPAITNARFNVQPYKYPDNKDLYHYTQLVAAGTSFNDLRQAATGVQNALLGSSGAIITTAHGSTGQGNSDGLAIWIPDSAGFQQLSGSYNQLQWETATNWGTFLNQQP